MSDKTLIVITGPTAVGKTIVAVKLAHCFHTEVISCDSRQIYKELSIGTAVPAIEELDGIRHHFIRNKSIHQYYNASMYEQEVIELLKHLFRENDAVIMAGGSGMYIDAVCRGIDDLPSVDNDLRKQLQEKYKTEGIESLRLMLRKLDPEYYRSVDLKNSRRILKALEVTLMTGESYSSLLTHRNKKRDFKIIKIGLDIPRDKLYSKINMRIDRMIELGLVEEARTYFKFKSLNALNTVGYRELFRYFEGTVTLNEAIDLIKRNTRKYARRQLTWLRRYSDMEWFDPDDINAIRDYIEKKITKVKSG